MIEILDSKGEVLNSYNSETPVLRPRGGTGSNMPGAGGAGPESQADPDAAPARRAAPPPRVTKTAGLNRFAGRDAIERYEVLKKELDAVRAEVDRLLGPPGPSQL